LDRNTTGKKKKKLNIFVNRYEGYRLNPKSKSICIETAVLSRFLKLRLVPGTVITIVPEGTTLYLQWLFFNNNNNNNNNNAYK
jgi:hypothetical protein